MTTQPNASSSNRVGFRGLNKISTGMFRNLPTLWPDRMMVKLKYMDIINTSLSITSGSLTNIAYRTNSLYDPLVATAPEQPLAGFAELAAMYNSYRVHAVNVTANIQSTSGNIPILVVMTHCINNTPPSSYAQALQSCGNPYSVWGQCGLGVGNSSLDLDNYVKLSKLVGENVVNTDNDYSSACTTNPVKQTFCIISYATAVASATFNLVPVVQLEFWAEFFTRGYEIS